MMFRIIGSVVMLALVTAACAAQERVQPTNEPGRVLSEATARVSSEQASMFLEDLFGFVELPCERRGSLVILNDGLVIVKTRSKTYVEGPDGYDKLRGAHYLWETKTFAFSPSARTTNLVHAGDEWFLDTAEGTWIRARGLFPWQVSVRPFDAPVPAGETSELLAAFNGDIVLDFDPAPRSVYRLQVTDHRSGEVFTACLRPVADPNEERGDAVPVAAGGCEAHCPAGDCEIFCRMAAREPGRPYDVEPRCWCDPADGLPHCECIKNYYALQIAPGV